MQRHFSTIEELSDIGQILRYTSEVCREYGALRQSYHLTPQFEAQNSGRAAVYAEGFRKEWLEKYDDFNFRLSDPIPERTMRHGALLTWAQAQIAEPNSPANEAYFKAMTEEGLVHGFGLPLFGPDSRNAFASFDFDKPISDVPSEALGVVRAVPQAAHQRICVLLARDIETAELSARETEVLQWVARGKSLSSIADILEISPDTVKTYSKRIYSKLNVSDRVGATVTALKLGLVRF